MDQLGKITIVGAGNLGIHLISRFVETQMPLIQIISRSYGRGSEKALEYDIPLYHSY